MTIKQLTQLIEEGRSLKLIAESYSEIASVKLRRIRSDVERNRLFLNEISQVYKVISSVAANKGIRLATKNNRTVSMLITSNYRFYGSINDQLIKFFLQRTNKFQTDLVIVGKTAQEYLQTIEFKKPHQALSFTSDLPTLEELHKLVGFVGGYTQILVFYSQLKSVLVQQPTIKNITEFQPNSQALTKSKNLIEKTIPLPASNKTMGNLISTVSIEGMQIDFILEPEVAKMLEFFDRQFNILLLEQTFLESELARTASRLIAMDQAQSNANDFIKDHRKELQQAKRVMFNNRLLESIASIAKYKSSAL